MPTAVSISRVAWAREVLRDLRAGLVSLQLTLVLLLLGMILVFAATLDQVNLGIWAVQEKYFRSFAIYTQVGSLALPIFPGGYTVGGLLLFNLIAAHVDRFVFTWKKAGIQLVHFGLIVLLVGELLTGLWQEDAHLRLNEGETKNYAESFRDHELVLIDATDPTFDTVVAIPEKLLLRKTPVQHPRLPFRVETKAFYPNSTLVSRGTDAGAVDGDLATAGVGGHITVAPQAVTHRPDERNVPAAFVELIGPSGSLGRWLVSAQLPMPQEFRHEDRVWRIALRIKRSYQPFSLTLLKFSHDRYAGTEIPRNFSSRVQLAAPGGEDREVLISMNNPLRHAGLTFYQAGFENNDRTTILQVVRNPVWTLPYVACGLMTLGLVWQFGQRLVTSRRSGKPEATGAGRGSAHGAGVGATAGGRRSVGRYLPIAATLLALLAIGLTWRAPGNREARDVAGFGGLPALVNGRVKPLDTLARTSLLMLQGRQRVTTPAGVTLAPAEWLLDVFYRPAMADTYQTFEIVHPEVLGLFDLDPVAGAGGKRFSLDQLRRGIPELDRQAKLADAVTTAERTAFQRAAVQLRNAVLLYQQLQSSVVAPGGGDFLAQLAQLERSGAPAGGDVGADGNANRELSTAFGTMERFAALRPIPPVTGADPTAWKSVGAAWSDTIASGRIDPTARAYAELGRAWREGRAEAFNQVVHEQHERLTRDFPRVMTKSAIETRFNSAQPFYWSAVLYVMGFLLAVVSWLKWPDICGRTARALVAVAFGVSTIGIVTRMWLETRPPVTNLYSSALFVGWSAVVLCLVLERIHRNGIGSAAGGAIGFATLLIAHHLALGGDTLELMRAVLDSNFWLATHVVTIAIGYSATFLAGFLAAIYVLRGVLTRSLDAATAAGLAKMIYGIVCFATLFSFVGTILGGIWADQSWGRFWGWDPKENGALLIVMWNAVILHARWGGYVQARGLAVLALFGNIVTAWSWFGVNMLGVGLHSYGFMDAAFWWLVGFGVSQVGLMLVAALPVERWRSFPLARAVTV